jgi:UDP-2,3-diacylglucosamine pyrophosphatase LpxH
MPRDIHTTADGRRLLVLHGHELDTVVQNIKWLAFVGDVGYQLLLKLNHPVNTIRRWLKLEYWSLSAYVKKNVKNAVSFIGAFEQAIVQYARRDEVDGVVCGHIHSPIIRMIENTAYYNSGDWVESLSALTEDFTGKIELITNYVAEDTSHPLELSDMAELPAIHNTPRVLESVPHSLN